MPKCLNCSASTSLLHFDLLTGLCKACQDANTAAGNREKQVERLVREEKGSPEPIATPMGGIEMMVFGLIGEVGAGIVAVAAGSDFLWLAVIISGISTIFFLGGIIRWSVGGANFIQLDRIQKQNVKIIEILETRKQSGPDEETLLLDRLHQSGQLSDAEYEEQKKGLRTGKA